MARRRSGKKIDFTRWDGSEHSFEPLAAGTAAQTFVTAGTATETLLRIRGNLIAYMDGLEAPAVGIKVGVGIALVPEGSGTTVTVSPLTDPTFPWLYFTTFFLGYEEMVTDVIDVPGLTSYRESIDNKAMRIIRPDVELQLVAENITADGAGSVNIQMGLRVLFGQ